MNKPRKNATLLAVSPVPLYTQIKDILRDRILDGTYHAHQQMPSESELMTSFGVSRITVRQALGDLQKEGLIFKIHGKGTFVSKPKAFQNATELMGFGEAMAQMGYETFNRLISHKHQAAGATIGERLGLPADAEVSELKRVRYLNRAPISLDVTFVEKSLGERLAREDLAHRDIFLILENDYGIALGRADLTIDAMLADSVLAKYLEIEEGAPVLRIERLTYTADGRPLDFEHLYYRGDAFQYRMRTERIHPQEK